MRRGSRVVEVADVAARVEEKIAGRGLPTRDVGPRLIRGHVPLIPLAERCGRVMRDALSALECLRAAPSEAVERSKPLRIALKL